MVAQVGSMVVAGSTEAAASVVEAAFAGMAAGASAERTAVFVEASEATAEATGGSAEAGVEVGTGVGVDSVGPISDLGWVSIPGPIGRDRISATTDITIIPSMGATILLDLIPAIHLATAGTATTLIPTART